MKTKINRIFKNPMLIVLLLVLILFTPQGLYSPGQSREIAVVVALGFDFAPEGYEVSLLTFIPKANQTFKEVNSVVSGKGENISQALYNAQIALGKRVGLSHVQTTVLSEQLLKENVPSIVDYLTRLAALSSSTVFIGTNGSAKELLSLSSKLEDGIGLDLEQVIGFNSVRIFSSETSLEEFYKGFYGRSHSSLIGYLPVIEGEENKQGSIIAEGATSGGGSISDSGVEGEGGNSGGKEKSKYILNSGQAVLLKNGEMVELLSLEQVNSINLINNNTKGQIIRIDDAEIDGETHNISYRIREKSVKIATKFENGYPVLQANINLGMELMEINGQHQDLVVRSEFSNLTPEIISKIEYKLRKEFKEVVDILQKNSADVLGVGDLFFKYRRKEYLSFIKNLESEDAFIKDVLFQLKFNIEPN
ncbi:MAG: hypothetical protein E7379_01010 [Clostridiales bacterium]|nr:hypothetical protein [Clostridiales bacterium]